jgi:glycosyltransferase involved in cell wall biosynthesis
MLVSIITPNYNCSQFIPQTIESVLAQTYQKWEMLIIDDCSTDGSYEIALKYAENDNRIHVFRMEKNSGTAVCRNKAIDLSRGEYLAFIDSDDIWLPMKLERQLQFMRERDCDFSFTEYEHIDENGRAMGIRARTIKKLTYQKMLLHCFPGCLTVVYRQDKEKKIYCNDIKKNNDHALFLRVLKKCKNARGLPEMLALYRIRKNSISRKKLQIIKPYIVVLHEFEHINILYSFFCLFTHFIIKLFFKYSKIPVFSKSEMVAAEDFLNCSNVYSYHKCLLSSNPPHIVMTRNGIRLALRLSKNYFARYTTDFDCEFETPWYYVLRDKPIKLEALNRNNRYNINRGAKYFYIQKIEFSVENIDELYRIYKKAHERYINFKVLRKSSFINNTIKSFESNAYYGVYYKSNNLLCGYASIQEKGNVANFNTIKIDHDYFKHGISYILIFSIANFYLIKKQFKYIHNGERSIRHDTEMQEFLIKRLEFRKAYAHLHVEYKPLFGLLVKICYPFRNIFKMLPGVLFHNVSSLLLQEQIARETNKLFT